MLFSNMNTMIVIFSVSVIPGRVPHLQDKQEFCLVAEIKVRKEIQARPYLPKRKRLIKEAG